MKVNWTPLWSDLLTSSVWTTPWENSKEVKILWVTIMALKDADGEVRATVPGLAKESGLTLSEVEGALAVLTAPDKWSRCTAEEGRRLVGPAAGPWKVVSNEEQWKRMALERKRARDRAAQARRRMRLKELEDQTKYPDKCPSVVYVEPIQNEMKGE